MAFIRAREIESELKNRGQERGTLYVLQVLAEQQIALQSSMRELATLVDQMANIVTSHTHVAQRMKETIDRLNNVAEEDLGHNTQMLGMDDD